MSSAYWSELAKLDDNLLSIQPQLNGMHAGLEFDENHLKENLTEARGHGAAIRDLIRAERSDAGWEDRPALERLIHELEIAAQERRNQLRRARLLELAGELDAGTVRHRLEARTATLTKQRQEAVKLLRTEAALADQVKELPGPRANQWVAWACGLQEEKDGFALSRLRKDFAALDRFIAGMEASYWVPGSSGRDGFRPSSESDMRASGRAMSPPPPTAPGTGYGKPSQTVKPPEKVATRSGSNGEDLSVPHAGPTAAAPSLTETLRTPEPTKQWQAATATVGNGASKLGPPRLNYCEQCGSSYPGEFHVCPVDRSVSSATAAAATRNSLSSREHGGNGAVGVATARDSRAGATAEAAPASDQLGTDSSVEAAENEFERLKALIGDSYSVEDDEVAPSSYQQFLGSKRTLGIVGAAVVVVLAGIFGVVHHFTSRSDKRPAPAPQTVSAKIPDVIPDADIQKNVEEKLATLKGSSIQVAVQDGVVTLSGKVAAKADVTKAETMSAEVSGVKQVTDKVQIETGNGKSGRRH